MYKNWRASWGDPRPNQQSFADYLATKTPCATCGQPCLPGLCRVCPHGVPKTGIQEVREEEARGHHI